jgi:hypothetical protein
VTAEEAWPGAPKTTLAPPSTGAAERNALRIRRRHNGLYTFVFYVYERLTSDSVPEQQQQQQPVFCLF